MVSTQRLHVPAFSRLAETRRQPETPSCLKRGTALSASAHEEGAAGQCTSPAGEASARPFDYTEPILILPKPPLRSSFRFVKAGSSIVGPTGILMMNAGISQQGVPNSAGEVKHVQQRKTPS